MLGLGFTFSSGSNKLNINLGSDLFRHGNLSIGLIKLDLDDYICSFYYVTVDENVEYVKWHNRRGHRKDKMNRLAKEAF